MEEGITVQYTKHINSYTSLITPYEETRAGFISLALEKSKEATPFVKEAKVLKILASQVDKPELLTSIKEIRQSMLTASGVSEKAKNHLTEENKEEAINSLIEKFLAPSGKHFIDELVYRFLLTKGDTLGGVVRNLAGVIGERKFTRLLVSTLSVYEKNFVYLDVNSKSWITIKSNQHKYEPELEKRIKGVHWKSSGKNRVLLYNVTVPIVKKNIDLCLLDCEPQEVIPSSKNNSVHQLPERYIALGELKGGIDPAGADEHWKTARSALDRIRKAFLENNCSPKTFFIGAAIEKVMAKEIYQQLNQQILTNGANLTNENQIVSLCSWLIDL